MPFDFVEYQRKCNGMTTEQLNKEWDNYTRQITSGSTSTATSVLLSVVTGGVSLVGLGFSAPRIHNARKKREIIEAGLQARGTTHHTHVKDVLVPMAAVGACSGLTLGMGISGAELLPTTGGIGHSVTEYAVSHAAASGTVQFVKFKAKELSKKNDEEASEAGIQTSHTWPLDAPDQEKFGPQIRPTVQPFSLFGHSDGDDDDELQPQTAQITGLIVHTEIAETAKPLAQIALVSPGSLSESPSDGDASPHTPLQHDQQQTVRSLSLPVAISAQTSPHAQTIPVQQENLRSLPAFQSFEVLSPDPILPRENYSAPQREITDSELDHLVSVLTDEEQMMLLMKLEMEVRKTQLQKTTPATSQPQLHRTSHVHMSHGRRPHLQGDHGVIAQQSSENVHIDSNTTPQLTVPPLQELDSLDGPSPALPGRSPSLPVGPYAAETPPSSTMPPRSPSLPVGVNTSQTIPLSSNNRGNRTSQILRKPLPSFQQQNCPTPAAPPQPSQTQLKDQRQDSGYYSAASTPSVPQSSEVPQYYAPSPSALATNLSREISGQEQTPRDSSFTLSPTSFSPTSHPTPTSFSPPPNTGGGKDYFNHTATPNTPVYRPAEDTSSPVQSQGSNILGIFGWKWETASTTTVAIGTNGKLGMEPDYGPPPPIPAAWQRS